MPIKPTFQIQPLDQKSFHLIDEVVMGHAFDIHNELGRFCDEKIYQNELAYRCVASGFDVLQEAMISVKHRDFSKQYFLDILIQAGSIYELKATKSLSGNHETQLINYLLLSALNHGKLINMRTGSVESRYVSTQLTGDAQRQYSFDVNGWDSLDPDALRLQELVAELLCDWGAFLEVQLYREALIHFMGGADRVINPINIQVGHRVVGKQKVCLASKDVAFHLSAIKTHHASYKKHMTRLLNHSTLKKIHWINFQGANIQLKTLMS